jgi:peroxiredoxin Q/BCP
MLSWFFSEPLQVGSPAPDFTLWDQDGTPVTLSALRGRNVVLVFYPADETRVCRQQLCEFRDLEDLARNRKITVYGVNPGTAQSHARFRDKQRLPFSLLVDPGSKVASLYRANGIIVKRTVYLIGMDGKVRFAMRGKPAPQDVFGEADIQD